MECSSQSAGQHLSGPVPTYEREAGLLGFNGQLGSMKSGNSSIMTLSYFSQNLVIVSCPLLLPERFILLLAVDQFSAWLT